MPSTPAQLLERAAECLEFAAQSHGEQKAFWSLAVRLAALRDWLYRTDEDDDPGISCLMGAEDCRRRAEELEQLAAAARDAGAAQLYRQLADHWCSLADQVELLIHHEGELRDMYGGWPPATRVGIRTFCEMRTSHVPSRFLGLEGAALAARALGRRPRRVFQLSRSPSMVSKPLSLFAL
jgi:hypothetical protein